VQVPSFDVRARELQRRSPAALSAKTVAGTVCRCLSILTRAVPAKQLREICREVMQEAGGVSRLPRLALGHPEYDPSLDCNFVGTLRLLESIRKPRKSLHPAGAISRFILPGIENGTGYDRVNVNFRRTYLDEKGGIAVAGRFGPGVLYDSDYEEVPLDDSGWAGPLSTNGDYFFRGTCRASV